jgi:hypothetical protein
MRNPYIKFTSDLDLSKAVGGRIVGCWQAIKDGPWEVLVEKPQAKRPQLQWEMVKPRERKAAAARKPRAAKPAAASLPATSFPGTAAANG